MTGNMRNEKNDDCDGDAPSCNHHFLFCLKLGQSAGASSAHNEYLISDVKLLNQAEMPKPVDDAVRRVRSGDVSRFGLGFRHTIAHGNRDVDLVKHL